MTWRRFKRRTKTSQKVFTIQIKVNTWQHKYDSCQDWAIGAEGNALDIGSDEILLCTEPQFKSFPRSWIRSLDYSHQFFQSRNYFLSCEVDMVTEEMVMILVDDNKDEVVACSQGWFVLLNISGVNFFNSLCANLRVCKVLHAYITSKS